MQKNLNYLCSREGSISKLFFRRTILMMSMLLPLTITYGYSGYGPDSDPNKPKKAEISAEQQQVTLTGTVTDKDNNPLPGVTVLVKGTQLGSLTNASGVYTLSNVPSNATLVFSFVGMTTQEIAVSGQTRVNIVLQEETFGLDEVVVIGYGVQKKETVVGSIAQIKTTELLQSPQANISNALVGRMSGLLSVQRSGAPGNDATTIRIRGVATYAGTADPLIMIDGIESTNYNNIDPNEIENISILKDASATAVYGVRGANGVVLITTKRGKVGKPQMSFTSSVARTSFPFLRDPMNSYEFATNYNLAAAYDSFVTLNYDPIYKPAAIQKYKDHSDPILYPDSDWMDIFLKEAAYTTRNNFNITGGAENIKYFVSLGYLNQGGHISTEVNDPGYDQSMWYKQYNLRSNFDFDITKRLKASLDLSTQIGITHGNTWSTTRWMEMLQADPPITSPGVIDNKIIQIPTITTITAAVFGPHNQGYRQSWANYLNGSVRLNYDLDFITKGLSARGVVSYRNYNTQQRTFSKTTVSYEARRINEGLPNEEIIIIPQSDEAVMGFSESVNRSRNTYTEAGLEYNQKFGNHNVTGLILYNQGKEISPDLSFLVPHGYQGLVGRVTYNYKGRYLGEFNIGYNGTENFAEGKRFGYFPAYSLGWVASDEPFFPKNNIVTFVKFRGSYGEVGNDRTGGTRFLYRPTSYTYGGSRGGAYYLGQIGSTFQTYEGSNEGTLGNPDLTWERAKKSNIGVEMKFFKNKFSLTADVFQGRRDNILSNKGNIPYLIGMTLPSYNLGKMINSGIDGDFTFNNNAGKFNYWIRANYTFAHNEILFQDEVPRPFTYQNRTGQRANQQFGWVDEGLFNNWEEVNISNRPRYNWANDRIQPGDIRYKDVNGDGIVNNDDQVPIGYSNFPEVMFGTSFGADYKGFDISILFQGASRVSNWPSRRSTAGFYFNTGADRDLLKSWSWERYTTGQEIVYPHLSGATGEGNMSHLHVSSTYWYDDATYLRLKNLELGYTFTKGLLTKIGLSSCRLYLNGTNLVTWSGLLPGIDPEFANGEANAEPYPITRVYNIGLKVNF